MVERAVHEQISVAHRWPPGRPHFQTRCGCCWSETPTHSDGQSDQTRISSISRTAQHRLEGLAAGGAADGSSLRNALAVQQDLVTDCGDDDLIHRRLGSLAGEFKRGFGGNVSGEQQRPLSSATTTRPLRAESTRPGPGNSVTPQVTGWLSLRKMRNGRPATIELV